ncbi:ABC-type phosphate transport system, substrate-binding component [Alteracholeplasma palmae J233]|uniref:ABC-type phosphate transport system, substrate-binding component n=1 Tax=Alteracholeplasma palmae (strain ATCC 49389 / J233) TaxID=1318466 RepID=U4KJN6_ALTPJ|nr:substrate-binding domain-containing protein [Alteracholeplasma palmae]CCV63744.1 ABC-type phosphate transport system, substrate-binding component [Alteracholeplasma palmae J233]
MKKILAAFLLLLGIITLTACTVEEPSNGGGDNETPPTQTDSEIQGYTRDSSSGTREAFFDIIGLPKTHSETTVAKVQESSSNGDMINKVKNDVNGIGYISLSSLDGSGLKGLKFQGVEATEDNVLNNTYELKRPFNYITKVSDESTESKLVEAFIAFINTQEGKKTIQDNGGIVEIKASDKKWSDIKSEYTITTQDNSAITIKFGGSTSVEKIAKALSGQFKALAGNFQVEHNHTGSGDAYKRTQGSEKDGANAVHIGFLSRNFGSSEANRAENTSGILAWDAVVAVVHTNNKLTNISASNLKAIFSGIRKNW